MRTNELLLQENPYISYTYAYPHKTAYRTFAEPIPLETLWRDEKRDALFLYMHIPFCEMRCGFCNLFTTVGATASFENDYLDAMERQAKQVRQALIAVPSSGSRKDIDSRRLPRGKVYTPNPNESSGNALGEMTIARMAIGGGTPTYLSLANLSRLFNIAEKLFNVTATIPCSVETSPLTAERDKLRLLREHGVERISIGVQSFLEEEAHAVGRAQKTSTVEHALTTIREVNFPTLNIDLIYGLPSQSVQSWLTSLETALRYWPEELYLYPLYVRPLTGLTRRESQQITDHPRQEQEDIRLECYRQGRQLLLSAGYIQESMRMFRLARTEHPLPATGPVYCTQDDGMVGLGCGARSYTHAYHYSNEYAVGAHGIRAILQAYINTPAKEFAYASYGFHLNEDEQRRRYVLKSLLEAGGIDLLAYMEHFGSTPLTDLPEISELQNLRLVQTIGGEKAIGNLRMALTPAGLELSDVIGPWLYSEPVQKLMGEYQLR